jgi:DNA end-binding protein Ku
MWTGAIRFGLVNVPVKLFSATAQKELSFHMLHEKDGGRIRQKRVCAVDGEEVPFDQVVKGYEIHKGQYVEISPEELARYHPKATQAIDIEDFVDLVEIDPIFYDRTYYLAPDRGAGKAYVLLLEAMKEMGKVGIARVVMRTKQYLCAVRPMGGALALSTLLYADEVRSLDEVEALPDEAELAPKPRELQMAKSLIDSLAAPFEPDKYKDEYREQVLALIERKAAGEEIAVQEVPEAAPTEVPDLMSALQASLDAVRGAESSGGKAAPKRKAPASRQKTASKG